jgi:DNA sulfur modification protein DndD
MVIETVTLYNFGVYKDRHIIDFSPASNKPIILFGGLNGEGKTTLLDAIQLALYGKNARCSNRNGQSYPDYLEKCVNRDVSKLAGASVDMQFSHVSNGINHTYRIIRSWGSKAGRINGRMAEVVRVMSTNNAERKLRIDEYLSKNWLENVDQFIPQGLAELFFFDGEKISQLAESEHASQMLRTAINSLLGIDLVDQLITDLVAFERKKNINTKDERETKEVEVLLAEINLLNEEIADFKQQRAQLKNELGRAEKEVGRVETKFKNQGGELFEQRQQLDEERQDLVGQLKLVEGNLRNLCAGALPFLLVKKLLAATQKQATKEQSGQQNEAFTGILEKRDESILKQLKRKKNIAPHLDTITDLLDKDRAKRMKKPGLSYLELDQETHGQLQGLTPELLKNLSDQTHAELNKIAALQESVDQADRKLAAIPDEDAIAAIQAQLVEAQKNYTEKKAKDDLLADQLQGREGYCERKNQQLSNLTEKNIHFSLEQKDDERKVRYSQKTRETMKLFRKKLMVKRMSTVEDLILDSFRQLIRKDALITRIQISPEDYTMTLFGKNGKELPVDRLSAGERQLLAISMLWGLARASGRPLPMIIDTPLGRLDSNHRIHLVERYFPHASHQVIILSTDEEVDEKYFPMLKSCVNRSYELQFSDETNSTTAVPGYFFN